MAALRSITYEGVKEGNWSLADVGRTVIRALRGHDWDISTLHNRGTELTPFLILNTYPPYPPRIHHATSICLYSWELEGEFPAQLGNALQYFEEIWSYSEDGARIFREAGLAQARAMPLGISTFLYQNVPARRARIQLVQNYFPAYNPKRDVLALYVGGTDPRHNVDILPALMRDAPPNLYLLAKLHPFYPPSPALESASPRLAVCRDDLQPAEMGELYAMADVLVHPARAVGFSLPVVEALSAGLPVLSTDLAPVRELDCAGGVQYVPYKTVPMKHHQFQTNGYWREPDVDEFRALLHAMAQQKPDRLSSGVPESMNRMYGTAAFGKRMHIRLMELLQQNGGTCD